MAADLSLKNLLISGAGELGIRLSDDQTKACMLFLGELVKWNRKINLTAVHSEREIIIKHFLDSLSYIKGFTPEPSLALLDMGSGAGFPALPLKIAYPQIAVTLVESVKKKASFLRHIIRTLGLDRADVMDKRTDELPETMVSGFDVVTARAFAGMEEALRQGSRFLKPGGVMVLSRGPEETIAEPSLESAGMVKMSRIMLTLPHSDYGRAVWVFRKPG